MSEPENATEEDNLLNGNEGEGGKEGGKPANTNEHDDVDKVTLSKEELKSRIDRAANKNQKQAIEDALNAYKEKQKEEENEAKRLEGMSAKEKADERAKKLEEENQALKMKMARSEMTSEARKQITEKGVEVDDQILDLLVTDEADTTNANIEAYATAVSNAAEKLVAKSRQGNSFGSQIGSGGTGSESEATRLARRQKELNEANAKSGGMFKRN